MSYTISTFNQLVNQYSSWQSLKQFLQVTLGGHLRIVETQEHPDYAIIRYVKGESYLHDANTPWVPWFRSVVWNTVTNRPVCVAPCKASNGQPAADTSLIIEEFVEGVMCNVFVDEQNNLHWSTRSCLNAHRGYYGNKTFHQMIQDVLSTANINSETIVNLIREGGYTFASFVLQHPEHRIVQKILSPTLYLIHLGKIDEAGNVTLCPSSNEWSPQQKHWAIEQYPCLQDGETPQQRMDSMNNTKPSYWQGLVFRGHNGKRWRIRSISYTILREVRGKESKVEERFTRLRSQNMIRMYLQNWPEEQNDFTGLEIKTRAITAMIYGEYCKLHKEKSKTVMDIPVALRTPVYELHGIYLNNLRTKNSTVKMPTAIQYVNTMNTELLANLLRNYDKITV